MSYDQIIDMKKVMAKILLWRSDSDSKNIVMKKAKILLWKKSDSENIVVKKTSDSANIVMKKTCDSENVVMKNVKSSMFRSDSINYNYCAKIDWL